MKFHIITLFPQMFKGVFSQSIIARAAGKKLIEIDLVNLRDFARDKHQTVDDKPYGGGKGMVARVDIVANALESLKPKPYHILLSASGAKYNQRKAQALTKKKAISLVCGHYEGVDARVEEFVDEALSIGDFVLTGGEIAAMAIIDSVARLIPGVIRAESLRSESFSPNSSLITHSPREALAKRGHLSLLEYPQYTRPAEFRGLKVPKILLKGNHQEIAKWRNEQAFTRTRKFRPDLLTKVKEKVQM